jgi:hypothetical protein
MTTRIVTSAGLATSGLGLAPLEEYLSVEAWLLALPGDTVMRIGLADGTSYLTSVDRLVESDRLGEVVDRFHLQCRLRQI